MRTWWRLMRPHTLTAAVMPVLIGTTMAWANGSLNFLLFLTMLIASVLIQAAVNMFNEYYDYKRGLDSTESVGIGGVIVHNEMEEMTVLLTAAAFFFLSVILGVYICWKTTWWIALVGSAGMGVGYFYSGGKSPLAYSPFGEAAAGIFMGPVIVLIAYFIQRDVLTLPAVLVSVPISILVASILLANNIRDSEGDRRKGRRTLAILLGHEKAISSLAFMFAAALGWALTLVLFGIVTPWVMVVILTIPKAVGAIRAFRKGSNAQEMLPAMKATSSLHTQFGILFSLGIILGKLLTAR